LNIQNMSLLSLSGIVTRLNWHSGTFGFLGL